MKKILFIYNGLIRNNGQVGISGGDIRLFEIIKNTKNREIHLLTTTNGEELILKYQIPFYQKHVINYVVTSGFKSNLIVMLKSIFSLPSGLKKYHGLVYSSCEHLYDVFPALILKIFNRCQWFAVYHWVEDYPWKEKRGGTPFLIRYLYWFNRFLAGLIIKYFADKILAVSDQTKDKLVNLKNINPDKIKAVYCGVELEKIRGIVNKYQTEKGTKYDAIFMKRLNYGKGVFDLLQIWREVVSKKPHAKLGIIGDGPPEVVEKVNQFIIENKLSKNFELLGVVYDFETKFRFINSSKIFILPTHEENWAIVIGEAMAAKTPVVCYNLKEIKPIWQDNVLWVDLGNIKQFAQSIHSLLNDRDLCKKFITKGDKFIEQYDWSTIGEKELL